MQFNLFVSIFCISLVYAFEIIWRDFTLAWIDKMFSDTRGLFGINQKVPYEMFFIGRIVLIYITTKGYTTIIIIIPYKLVIGIN